MFMFMSCHMCMCRVVYSRVDPKVDPCCVLVDNAPSCLMASCGCETPTAPLRLLAAHEQRDEPRSR